MEFKQGDRVRIEKNGTVYEGKVMPSMEGYIMRTEKIGEDKGKITGMRVIEGAADHMVCEYDFQDKGSILGIEFETSGTSKSVINSEGMEYDDGEAVMLMKNGDFVSYHFTGLGNSTKKGYEAKVQLTLQFTTNSDSEELQRLCRSPVLAEFATDEEGNTRTTYYEWNF